MTPEPNTITSEPLNKLLDDLVDARLERRQGDIERLEREICQRQARGEGLATPPDFCGTTQS
jgi:hypothetical protein